ncbi:ABC transporter substrate-binding protein [Natronohydrobacter thiooxidans]|uniref:ABC transporter substrate-binding protein n=1 Tax=Natronohydrobacter thiooxidans TaxID=87172 RepID=UPI0008FF473C|nr:ABC transporter substrate-binding protein [Natronohydrobacter thiooxidans]
MRLTVSIAALCAGLAAPVLAQSRAEVIHWWTSEGESLAVRALGDSFAAAGGEWLDNAIAGASGARQAAVTRILAGDPPAASQFNTGREYEDLVAQGLLVDISDIAADWGQTMPASLLAASQLDDRVYAMPMNIHGRNWIWYNTAVLAEAGATPPTGWGEDMFAALDLIAASGRVPLALSGTPSYILSLFESVLLDRGGPGMWNGLYGDRSDAAFADPRLRDALETFARLRDYVDAGSSGRAWNATIAMIINGTAGISSQGDWAKAEFAAAGLEPGTNYGCVLPGGVLMIGGDVFVFPAQRNAERAQAQRLLIETLADAATLRRFNQIKGSIPPRNDVDMSGTDICAETGSAALRSQDTSVPRLSMLVSGTIAGEVQDLIVEFWSDPRMSVDAVIARYRDIVQNG